MVMLQLEHDPNLVLKNSQKLATMVKPKLYFESRWPPYQSQTQKQTATSHQTTSQMPCMCLLHALARFHQDQY